MMKHLANVLTGMRIVLSLLLIFCKLLGILFLVIYMICGLTDMIDGTIARKTNSESKMGAMLDSIADMVFVAAAMLTILPVLISILPRYYFYIVIIIAFIKIIAYIIGMIRFHHFVALHTIMNKATGLALFFIPYILISKTGYVVFAFISLIATVAAVEELLCMLLMKEEILNIKTVFVVHK